MNTQPHYMNDKTLIQLLKSDKPDDNDKALRYIIVHKQKNVMSKLRVPTHMNEDAMFNDALFELWKYVRKYDFDTSKKDSIERFLYIVCKRYIIRNSGKGDTDIDELPEPFEYMIISLLTREQREELCKIFDRLGIGCKEILALKYFAGLSYKEIAEETDYTKESARVKRTNCIKKLKEWIAQDDDLAKFIRDLLNY